MIRNKPLAVVGVLSMLALGLTAATTALAGPTGTATVTVRVEGLNHELLAPKTVKTVTGSITKGGTPKGKCPATSAAGALDVATKHDWNGTYDKTYSELEVTSILGEAHSFTSNAYWEIFAGNVAAQVGACELKIHNGEQLLFAAVPDKGPTEYPIALELPSTATAGKSFTGKVVYYNAKGKPKPLAGATVATGSHSGKTGSNGTIKLTAGSAGTFTFTAAHKGYIRAAPVTLHVTG